MQAIDGFAATLVEELSRLHAQLRQAVEHLDEQTLAWHPGPDTNSISTIVVHVLGSEAELLRLAAGSPAQRDRPAEFAAPPENASSLVARVDGADHLLEELGPALERADLNATFTRPSAVRNREPRTALFWLLNGYGHGREHLAQIHLTQQMFASGTGGSSA